MRISILSLLFAALIASQNSIAAADTYEWKAQVLSHRLHTVMSKDQVKEFIVPPETAKRFEFKGSKHVCNWEDDKHNVGMRALNCGTFYSVITCSSDLGQTSIELNFPTATSLIHILTVSCRKSKS